MTKANLMPRGKWPMPLRIIFARPRLFLSILAGLGVVALLPLLDDELRGVTRFLLGWDVGVFLYLALLQNDRDEHRYAYPSAIPASGLGRFRNPGAHHHQRRRERRRGVRLARIRNTG
jgi:hypothetical protein